MPKSLERSSLLDAFTGPSKSFAFVNLSRPEDANKRKTRREIHRHVMKRNGLARRRKPRQITIPLEVRGDTVDEGLNQDVAASGRKHEIPLYASLNPSGILHAELDDRTMELLYFASSDYKHFYRPFRHLFVRMAVFDATACKLVMANAVVFLDQTWRSSSSAFDATAESAKYYTQSCKELSLRLSDPGDRIGDGVIATVLGFLCHDANVGNWKRWTVHIDGLQKLLGLRGGLKNLDDEISLLASWLDLIGAAVTDSSPIFPAPSESITASTFSPVTSSPGFKSLCKQLDHFATLSPVKSILQRMHSVSEFVNSASVDPAFCRDAYTAVELLAPVSHAVLSLPKLTALDMVPPLSTLFEITRLTCLLLLAKLKEYFSHHASEMEMLQHKLINLLEKSDLAWVHCLPDLALWSLVSASLVIDRRHMTHVATWINHAMYACRINSARQAVRKAEDIVWIEAIERTGTTTLIMEIDECSRPPAGT